MPNCTCGATLPEDARFCHRCGKPQWEEPAILSPEPVVVAGNASVRAVNTKPAESRVAFNDPLTLRSCLLVASITTVLITTVLGLLPFATFALPLLGGFASVALYQRRSGQVLNMGEGAKLGWITAVISSILLTVFLTLSIAISGPNFETVRQQIRSQAPGAAEQQLVDAAWFPAFIVLFLWIFFFVFASVLSVIGGALGARFRRQKAL